ncbi:MAG: glycosyltransferase family 9 protein [Ignavibacteriales bacterium]|nr:glycosyltransferase family 9 protein [Ignavibacteriales bacterium]
MTLKEKIEKNRLLNLLLSSFLYLLFKLIRIIKKRSNNNLETIAIIVFHKLGDSVFVLPALKKIIEEHSNKRIYIFCYRDTQNIYEKVITGVKYVILDKSNFLFDGRFASKESRRLLKSINPSTIVDLTGTIVSASLVFNSNANHILGINEPYYKAIYDDYHAIRKSPHLTDIYLDAIYNFCLTTDRNYDSYPIRNKRNGDIFIQPFAGWPAKEWSFIKFLELYKRLNVENECAFIVPKSSIKSDVYKQMIDDEIRVIETESISHFINLLDRCKLFISNDSGPLQIAALYGVPTLSIYGPTNPKFHMPIGSLHRFVRKKIKCTPIDTKYCFTFGGRYCPHYDCLVLLSTDEIFNKAREILVDITINN